MNHTQKGEAPARESAELLPLERVVRNEPPLRFITLDYGMMIDALRDVSHLSDTQLSWLGGIIAHRLRDRNARELANMIEVAASQLRKALDNSNNTAK